MFLKFPNFLPHRDRLRADAVVIGSGPGGAIASTLLAKAGRDVMLLEEGPFLPLESALHFSREEIAQKYRNGGLTVSMGKNKVAYVEGRCVGGGSEINRGLYHRTPPEVLETWQRQFGVAALSEAELRPHFEACEQRARVSYLAEPPPPLSLKLHEGALKMGWASVEVPRLVCYEQASKTNGVRGTKQSMTQTFIPQYLEAGGRLMPNAWVRSLSRHGGRWHVQAAAVNNGCRWMDIEAKTVFVACGAIQTPALLRRSGWTRHVGHTLRFHPMIKVIAQFPQEVNPPGMLDPVHQIKEFDPRFSMGCSISSKPVLALTMMAHPECLPEVQRNWRHMGIYYAQTTGGEGSIRTLPGCRDPLIRMRFAPAELQDLSEALRRLCECLFAAGAIAVYPAISGLPVLRSEADMALLPVTIPVDRANLSTLHLFSSCRMGEERRGCVADSFGKMHEAEQLYIIDASLLCGPTAVNPQGTVMAIAHRNIVEFLNS
jgi:choline dehydrogenase-like flavoprotein